MLHSYAQTARGKSEREFLERGSFTFDVQTNPVVLTPCKVGCLNTGNPNGGLSFFHKFRLQLHCADAVNPAIDIMVALDQAEDFDFSTDFNHGG